MSCLPRFPALSHKLHLSPPSALLQATHHGARGRPLALRPGSHSPLSVAPAALLPLPKTGGTELRTMMRVVDHELSTQLNTFQALVSALHERQTGGASATASTARKLASQTGADAPGQAGVAAAPGPGSVASGMAGMGAMPAPGALGYGEDSEEVAATLRLLLVHADVSAGLNRLEADIRCGQGVDKCVDGVWTPVYVECVMQLCSFPWQERHLASGL